MVERAMARARGGETAVEIAVSCLGVGVDMASDLRLRHCKAAGGCLVARSGEKAAKIAVPGVGVLVDLPADVKCGRGGRTRLKSDVLEFNQMTELFNRRSSVPGKIPSGLFNAAFGLDAGSWAQDASSTKCLALDGYFISLLDLTLDCSPLAIAHHVVADVPATWDPSAIASFIEKYGTHVVVGVSMGGQDVVYVKQDKSSPLPESEIKEHLEKLGDQLFTGTCALRKSRDHKTKVPEAFNVFDDQFTHQRLGGVTTRVACKEGVTVIHSKRGGDTAARSHAEWLLTLPAKPDAIRFRLMPLTSLLRGVTGLGFLSHAINLYLRYKPPVADLRYFLDFQHHKSWAPVLSDLPLGLCSNRRGAKQALHFSLVGSKLHVNSNQVIVPHLAITGMRLHLEGKKNNRLGLHLQHLASTPTFIVARPDQAPRWRGSETISDERHHEPVQRRMFAHVCTAPVKYDPHWCSSARRQTAAYIVSGAQLHVAAHDSTSVLHLRLMYTELLGYAVVQSKWAHNTARLLGKGTSFLSMPFATASKEWQEAAKAGIDSGVFARGPPVPVGDQKLLKYVDAAQVTMGPQDGPGYWLATGARLDVEKGKISLHVKFSLLAPA
ncbi:unnamed protein product [Alopecurus aequalis]